MNGHAALERQKTLISALASRLAEQAPEFAMFETHISCILVAGEYAYKFKKAVRFDFLDFSTLELRHFYCQEELRLNARLAPDLYLNVVPITLRDGQPLIDGPGTPVEYAVKMRAFAQEALWSYRLQTGLLTGEEVDLLADKLAHFHHDAAVAPVASPWCTAEALQTIADETLNLIVVSVQDAQDKALAEQLQQWETLQRATLAGIFAERKSLGMIRECHGDLHGGNILTTDGQVEAFDCIEFNDSLRWIDVINDIAFVCMDLRFRRHPHLAARFLNRYLEASGDYGGLFVLRYYEVHRALIRCKIALLRAAQPGVDAAEVLACRQQARDYLALAIERIVPARPAIMITHGFSGCGKSTLARQVVEAFGVIQLRSDVERKRMHGMSATTRGATGLYQPDVTQHTYEHLVDLARQVVQSGVPVLVDATFLQSGQRRCFQDLAAELNVPFLILDIQAYEATMKARIAARERRANDASDAGLAVLAQQIASHEILSAEEMRQTIAVNAELTVDPIAMAKIGRLLLAS